MPTAAGVTAFPYTDSQDSVSASGTVSRPSPVNEVQSLSVDAAGGTFTMSFGGKTTAALAFNITAAALQTALRGLSSIGAGNVTVTGGVGAAGGGTPYVVTFVSALSSNPQALLTTDATLLTGGAGTATVTESTLGVNADVASIAAASLAAGLYRVEAYWNISGAAEALVQNLRVHAGNRVLAVPPIVPVVNTPQAPPPLARVVLDGATALALRPVAQATASTVYTAMLVATRVAS